MSRVRESFSFWALVSFSVLLALQWFPYTGIILLMLGAAAWCGLAVNAFLLGVLVEATLGKIPRFLMIIPFGAYGGYYVAYAQQSREISAKAVEMQISNPTLVLSFDPAAHSLVTSREQAERLAARYGVPVTYEVNANVKPEGHVSHRLLDREQCARARGAQASLRSKNMSAAMGLVAPVQFDDGSLNQGFLRQNFLEEVCLMNFPERPPFQQINVTRRGNDAVWERQRAIMEQFVDFSVNGQVFATYKTASVWRLPILPILSIGCFLNSGAPSWNCLADFQRSYEVIDGTPKSVDKARYDSPESVVLGLHKFMRTDYTNFRADRRWTAIIDRLDVYPEEQLKFKAEQKADLFAQFVAFVQGSEIEPFGEAKPAPPFEMDAAILDNSERLIPLRDAMVARLIQLLDAKIGVYNKWYVLLLKSIYSLPRDSYATMPDAEVRQLLDALASYRYHSSFLYTRMADAGPRTLSFYENELKSTPGAGPALAICRIGEASEASRAILRKQFTESSKSDDDDARVTLNSSMFVTLLKLGDPAAVDGYPINFKRAEVVSWYDAVRQGRGRTEIGPNNCNGWERNTYRPPSLRPGLVYSDKTWIEAGAK